MPRLANSNCSTNDETRNNKIVAHYLYSKCNNTSTGTAVNRKRKLNFTTETSTRVHSENSTADEKGTTITTAVDNCNERILIIPTQTIRYDSSYFGICPHGVGVANSCNCCMNPIIPKTSLQKHMRNIGLHKNCYSSNNSTSDNSTVDIPYFCAKFLSK
jgi:hypothetical protein